MRLKTMLINIHRIVHAVSIYKRHLFIAIFILCLIGAVSAWEGLIKDNVIPKKFGIVESGTIYRSGRIAPRLIKTVVTKYNIKAIISLSGDSVSELSDNAERKISQEMGIERLIFSLKGNGTGDVNDYVRIVAAICQFQREGKPVLVRCAAGAQRTGGIIAVYRLIIENEDINFIKNEMIQYGHNPNKNPSLRLFLNSNIPAIAEKLKDMGVIDEIPSSLSAVRADSEIQLQLF
jgi:protein tyrosine/serine phosphatase